MTAEEWIRVRLPDAPPELVRVMIEALPAGGNTVPDCLANGAQRLYVGVLEGSGGREDALPLLAADALLTHAFQAAAEMDPINLDKFVSRWSGNRLAEATR